MKWPWKGRYRRTFLSRHANGERKGSVLLIFFLLPQVEIESTERDLCVCVTTERSWPKKVRFFPGVEFIRTAAGRRLADFRASWRKSKITGERTEKSCRVRKGQWRVEMLNQVTQERVKVKAGKDISRWIALPLMSYPPPGPRQLENILHFTWQEDSKWPVVKIWESLYGLFAWPFPFRSLVYAWVLWKPTTGQPPKAPFTGNKRTLEPWWLLPPAAVEPTVEQRGSSWLFTPWSCLMLRGPCRPGGLAAAWQGHKMEVLVCFVEVTER